MSEEQLAKKENQRERAKFAAEETVRLATEAAARVHDCKKAGCTIKPDGTPV